MRLPHGRIVGVGYCASAENRYLQVTKAGGERLAMQNEEKRKGTDMAAATATRPPRSLTLRHDLHPVLRAAIDGVSDWGLYRRTVCELSDLSGRDLADLGLHRREIRRVAHDAVYGARR